MSQRGYQFAHVLGGQQTQLLDDVRILEGGNDNLAQLAAIHHARRLKKSGVSGGKVVVTGIWDARGFTYEVSVTKSESTTHPLEKLSDKPYEGFEKVCDTIMALWPNDGPAALHEYLLTFSVWEAQVTVKISHPRGPAVDMIYAGETLSFGLTGPTEYIMVAYWGITSRQAEKIWKEVCKSVANLGKQYLKK